MEKKSVSALCLLILVVFASQEVMVVHGGRMCQSVSQGFTGMCFNGHHCALACHKEGFTGGHCHGLHHRCYCTKLCFPSP